MPRRGGWGPGVGGSPGPVAVVGAGPRLLHRRGGCQGPRAARVRTMSWSALVSGGNRGIGLEVVRSLLAQAPSGATIFLGCRDLAAGTALAATLAQPGSASECVAVQLDVTDAASIAAAVDTVGAATPHLSCLVNNAGIMPEAVSPEFKLDAVRETMATNFDGAVVAVTTAFLPLLLKAPENSASVLSVSSGVGARTMGLLRPEHRDAVSAPELDDAALAERFEALVEEIGADPDHPYRSSIPTVVSDSVNSSSEYSRSSATMNCRRDTG